jgi:hypothetical protein
MPIIEEALLIPGLGVAVGVIVGVAVPVGEAVGVGDTVGVGVIVGVGGAFDLQLPHGSQAVMEAASATANATRIESPRRRDNIWLCSYVTTYRSSPQMERS